MKLKRIDSISMDQTYYTDEGYLVDHPIVTTSKTDGKRSTRLSRI